MEWLIAIIALIGGLIIGWWLANRACEERHGAMSGSTSGTQSFASPGPAQLLPEAEPDDLTKIEGIGPKIGELLNIGGVYTFSELASTPVDRLAEILEGGGARFAIHNPGTWPQQAQLAAAGHWEELQTLQDELDGGRPV